MERDIPAQVDAARAEFAALAAAYRDLVAAASKASGASLVRVDAALAAFEPHLFNNLLVALDARFARRPAGDGGDVLDEVRLLVDSLVGRGGRLGADGHPGYEPGKSVLKIDRGDAIALNGDDFAAICAAFLAEVERRQTP